MTGQSRPAYLEAGGVFLPGEVCEQLWRFLHRELQRHRSDGGRVRPELVEAVEVLRKAAQAHLLAASVSANGLENGHQTDLRAWWDQEPGTVTTEQAATRLGITSRHLRRIANTEGVHPVAHNTWNREDIESLANTRR